MGAKNLIYDICKLIGVEVDEKFKLKHFDDTTIFSISNTGSIHILVDGEYSFTAEHGREVDLTHIIMHYDEIIKLPWRPKDGERYWTFASCHDESTIPRCVVEYSIWMETMSDFARLKAGWVHRTREEAKAALPAVAKELWVEYELQGGRTND